MYPTFEIDLYCRVVACVYFLSWCSPALFSFAFLSVFSQLPLTVQKAHSFPFYESYLVPVHFEESSVLFHAVEHRLLALLIVQYSLSSSSQPGVQKRTIINSLQSVQRKSLQETNTIKIYAVYVTCQIHKCIVNVAFSFLPLEQKCC